MLGMVGNGSVGGMWLGWRDIMEDGEDDGILWK